MKVTIVTRDLGYGGAQRQIIVLARELKTRGHDVQIVLLYSTYCLEPEVVHMDVAVISLDKSGRWDVPRTLWRLIQFLRRDQPDILHAYLDPSNTVSILVKPFISSKIVWGMRVSGMDAGAYDDWLVRMIKVAERQLGRFADLIVFNSHAGLDALAGT